MWPEYVPAADRRAKSERETKKMMKQGQRAQPVRIEGRLIARSFWGKGWCTHLEYFGDYSNRLPRGRSYVRNGSVCHLEIASGAVEAMVTGSSLYKVKVSIQELNADSWNTLKSSCAGKIGSLIELLQGRLSDEIMRLVTDPVHGLFPKLDEIRYTCDCPDWADMCKHIAAVMYGIGARLDEQPELLFLLRGVDHEELLSAEASVDSITGTGARQSRRRILNEDNLADVFGVEFGTDESVPAVEPLEPAPAPPAKTRKPGRKPTVKTKDDPVPAALRREPVVKAKSKPGATAARRVPAFEPTGRTIKALRQRLGMNKSEFARAIGVAPATVAKWERATGAVYPHSKGTAGLRRLHAQTVS